MVTSFIIAGMWEDTSEAFEIRYPDAEGFFIGRPMAYVITADSDGDEYIGQEGVFIFGRDRITIDGKEYYDSVFESPSDDSHFYLGIDPVGGRLIQKGLKIGTTELKVDPAVTAVDYPLSPGDSWSESTDLTAKDLQLPGFGMPLSPSIKGVKVKTEVSPIFISVPAGSFNTLFVESTYAGSLWGIPITFIQRTWLSEENIPVKRKFVFLNPAQIFNPEEIVLYEIELSKLTLTPWDVNWDGFVNLVDLVMVARHYGERIGRPMVRNPDVNGDGIVGIQDLAEVAVYFGRDHGLGAPAKHIRADVCPADLCVLRDVYQEILLKRDQLSGDDLAGIGTLLRVMDLIFSEYPPLSTVRNALFQSYPNPCNPEVWIPYALEADSPVTIEIHNASGQLIRELALGHKRAGMYASKGRAAHWNGKNGDGERVASGVYFYTIRAGEFTATRRMMVLE